jgi:hypothetical protein
LSLAAGSNLFILRAQRFDPATQQWVTLILNNTMIADYTIRPGEGFFIQVRDKGSLPMLGGDHHDGAAYEGPDRRLDPCGNLQS